MRAFLYCARSHPDKTEVIWSENASSAIILVCKALKLHALHVEMERVPELDGLSECSEEALDTYRIMMMDKYPRARVVAPEVEIQEDEYREPDPIRYEPRTLESEFGGDWGQDEPLVVFQPLKEKRPHKTPKPSALKGLKRDTPDLSGPKERPKKKPKPRDSAKNSDKGEWGRRG